MRITNKIMQSNSLYNLNNNKILSDKLNTQMSTYKKITKPSDDPVIAIRALRLRSTLSEVTQFYEKNIPDADSWLKVTEGALSSITDIVEDLIDKTRDGSNSKLETSDRLKIIGQMKALRDEIYATGDADYAGRSLFTGYRTGVKLRFQEDAVIDYRITEKLTKESISSILYVDQAGLDKVNKTNYDQAAIIVSEQSIDAYSIDRFRLAYGKLGEEVSKIGVYDEDGTLKEEVDVEVAAGTKEEAYKAIAQSNKDGESKALYIPETGEVLLSDKLSTTLQNYPKTTEFRITYQKTNWDKNDLRPEHYFVSEDKTNNIMYDTPSSDQEIVYAVGFNQNLRINTTARDAYTHDIGRDVDELVRLSEQVIEMEKLASTLEDIIANETDETKKAAAKKSLDAANKALTFLRGKKMQDSFESGITNMQGYMERATLAVTNCGTRSARLELVRSRLETQQTSFKTLVSENEDIDITQAAIAFESSQVAYNAAMMATGKVVQNSLLDFL